AGVLCLGVGYSISLRLQSPFSIEKLLEVTIAIALVIIATYLLFIAGSVALCKLLKKNKKYYYQPKHFISVSSMMYRMKRNGAGLASICILSTMVLVILSTTVCMYAGTEDSLNQRYPRQMMVTLDTAEQEEGSQAKEHIDQILSSYQTEGENPLFYRYYTVAGGFEKDQIQMVFDSEETSKNTLCLINFLPLEDYNRMTGETITLQEKELLLYTSKFDYLQEQITLGRWGTFAVKEVLEDFFNKSADVFMMAPIFHIILSDEAFAHIHKEFSAYPMKETATLTGNTLYAFDTSLSAKQQVEVYKALEGWKQQWYSNTSSWEIPIRIQARVIDQEDFYGVYGAILILGIFLSIVFLLGQILTMYYKQVTEGYEDQARYTILQKVGMSQKEIKKTINAQILLTFFLPLGFAGIHLLAAFNLIAKVLELVGLVDVVLLAKVAGIAYIIFGIFYALVYRFTSKVYYQIVSQEEM
ncbi:MAG: ABC transporter permease, partial [Clostridiales bacterium]|nr:ABC transporter permease [Clostridiales bacterium]